MKRAIVAMTLWTLWNLSFAFASWPLFHGNDARTGYSSEITTAGLVALWDVDLGSPIYVSPVVSEDRVFIGTADARLLALNPATGAVLWSVNLASWSESTPAVANGQLFFGCNDHKVYSLNAATGGVLWQAQTSSWVESSPLVFSGKVYIGGMDHKLYAYDAASGALTFSITTNGDVLTAPATDGQDVFFAGDDEMIHAITSTGGALWTVPAGGAVFGAPVAADGKIVYGSIANGQGGSYNRVRALNASTGAQVWLYESTQYDFFYGTPAVGYGNLYVGGFQGTVIAFDLDGGAIVWERRLGDWALVSSAALSEGVLYVGCNDGKIYALDAFSGAVLDWAQTGGFLQSSPAVSDGRLFIGSADGHVYAFDVTAPVAVATTAGSTTVPPGGTLQFSVTFNELQGQSQSFVGWLSITRPTGQQLDFGNPVPLSLTAGQVLTLNARLNIPLSAPAGGYILAVNAGPTPTEIWDASSFPFTITGSDGGNLHASEWEFYLSASEAEPLVAAPYLPSEFQFAGPVPNPFNPSATLRVALPQAAPLSLKVYDASGRLIGTLMDGFYPAGVHAVIWNAEAQSAGVYFFRLNAGEQTFIQRGILVK
jgi:outer membrane protein assembly factor BamB